MGEQLQLMVPVDQTISSVYSTGQNGTAPITGTGLSGDFFQMLLAQIQESLQNAPQEGMSDFFAFPFPMEFLEQTMATEEGQAQTIPSIEGMVDDMPFPFFAGEMPSALLDSEGMPILEGEGVPGEALPPEMATMLPVFAGEMPGLQEGESAIQPDSQPMVMFPFIRPLGELTNEGQTQPFVSGEGVNDATSPPQDGQMDDLFVPANDINNVPQNGQEMFMRSIVSESPFDAARQVMPEQVEVKPAPEPVLFESTQEEPLFLNEEKDFMTEYFPQEQRFLDPLIHDTEGGNREFGDQPENVFSERFNFSDTGEQALMSNSDTLPDSSLSRGDDTLNFQNSFEEFNKETTTAAEHAEVPKDTQASFQERMMRHVQDAQAVTEQIVKSAQFRQTALGSEFKLALEPDYLGSLKVSVALEGDSVVARIVADTMQTRDLLNQNIGLLKTSFENAGINCDNIEVSHNGMEQHYDTSPGQQSETGDKAQKQQGYEDVRFEIPGYADSEGDPVPTGRTFMARDMNISRVNYLV